MEEQMSSFERAIRSIVSTSVDDGVQSARGCSDIDVLREALRRESARTTPRRGLLDVLERRVRRMETRDESWYCVPRG